MVDYYSVLWRAVTGQDAGDERWRHDVYDRARQMLASRLRAARPPAPLADIAREEAALEAAIERIEAELAWTERTPAGDPGDLDDNDVRAPMVERDRASSTSPVGLPRAAWIALAVFIAAAGAGGVTYWLGSGTKTAPVAGDSGAPAAKTEATPVKSATPPGAQTARATSSDGDLAAGVDGGNSDPDLPYVYRRQPTFYRTLQPVGTIIVDKLQRFLYLIQPNNVALRYGIAVGSQCADVAGLRHVASMAEWPPWQPPPEMLNRNPSPMPGGPGNPLGARMLQLDDGSSRINGTNAPKTIGNVVTFGCIRLDNDDIVDLYNRVKVSTPVLLN